MLTGPEKFGLSHEECLRTAKAIKALSDQGVQVGVVIGGGNILRGSNLAALGVPRPAADQMGMLATMINGLALQQSLNGLGCPTRIMGALECPRVVETFTWARAIEYLEAGFPVVFVGGTGNAFFTTDTTAALRASEIQADILLKATKVNGIYNKDPNKYPDAVKYETITYGQMLAEKLEVMDATAIAMCRSGSIPILVFNMSNLFDANVLSLLSQKNIGTFVTPG